jgi:apolipoprotein D and lipocalin family protein
MLISCSTIPKGVLAIRNFDKQKYLGRWYEIARMDFRFERNLNNVTATYTLNQDGSIKVENKGFDYKQMKWKQATGKAKFAGQTDVAMLKVSFFGPFYAGYNVIAIDKDYKYALVTGKNLDYAWILSRETQIPENIKSNYLKILKESGFKTSLLIWTEHTTEN